MCATRFACHNDRDHDRNAERKNDRYWVFSRAVVEEVLGDRAEAERAHQKRPESLCDEQTNWLVLDSEVPLQVSRNVSTQIIRLINRCFFRKWDPQVTKRIDYTFRRCLEWQLSDHCYPKRSRPQWSGWPLWAAQVNGVQQLPFFVQLALLITLKFTILCFFSLFKQKMGGKHKVYFFLHDIIASFLHVIHVCSCIIAIAKRYK